MPYPIEQKLVIGVASSALFDLTVSDDTTRPEGSRPTVSTRKTTWTNRFPGEWRSRSFAAS